MSKSTQAKVTEVRAAGEDHQVVTVVGGGHGYMKQPCPQCPWRVDQTGSFPAEAFRHSANTSEDMSCHTFACHMAGAENPKDCAGFLLNGAEHNLSVRMAVMKGRVDPTTISDGGLELHESYLDMAIANGVPADDPALSRSRKDDDDIGLRNCGTRNKRRI